MRKLLNNPWVVTALAAGAIAFVWFSLAPKTSPQRSVPVAAVETEAPAPAEPTTSEGVLPLVKEALKELALPKAPRDPFAVHAAAEPTTVQEKKPEEPDFEDSAHLTGVWTQNGTSLILLNDHIRNVGDSIGRFKIESANQDGIWLTHWKGRTFLALGKSFVLKTPVNRSANISSK